MKPEEPINGSEEADSDLKNRIDSSDQDEDASYEDINEDDLKTHSSGEAVGGQKRFVNDSSIAEEVQKNSMMMKSSAQYEDDDNYSSDRDQETPNPGAPYQNLPQQEFKNENDDENYSDDYSQDDAGKESQTNSDN